MKARKFTREEEVTFDRFLWDRYDAVKQLPDRVAYSYRDGFTTCVLLSGRKVLSAGASKRNPIDTDNPKRGQFLALRRALEAMK